MAQRSGPLPTGTNPPGRTRGLWWLVAGVLAVHLWLLGMWLQNRDMVLVRSTGSQNTPARPLTVASTPAQALPVNTPPAPSAQPAATTRIDTAASHPPQRRAGGHPPSEAPTQPLPSRSSEIKNKAEDHLPLARKQIIAIQSDESSSEAIPPEPSDHTAKPTTETTALQATPAAQHTQPQAENEASTGTHNVLQRRAPALWTGSLRVPPSAELRYTVKASRKGLSMGAESTLSWTNEGNSYRAKLEVKSLLAGSRTQTSVGRIDRALGLQPERFGDRNKQEQATHFDRTQPVPTIRFSNNAADEPLYPQTQDRLSVLFQLAAMAEGEPKRFQQGHSISVHTANSRNADIWRFVVGTTETLELPLGTLTAMHLVRAPQQAYDNQVEVWLAPSMGHLPVRMLWTQANGDVVDQRLAGHIP